MKKLRLTCFWIILQSFFIVRIYAQQENDSVALAHSISNIRQFYFNEIGSSAQLYHGNEFISNGLKVNGFPYYESDKMISGSISYQGITYPSRDLFYNIVSDEVIIYDYLSGAKIALSPQKADSFRIRSHLFVFLFRDKSNSLPQDGYYEVLYAGEPAVFAKRSKRLISGTGTEDPAYFQYDDYFVRFGYVYHVIDGKSALLELMKDKRENLNKYIRANLLNFKKNLQSSLLMTTIYYSRLKS